MSDKTMIWTRWLHAAVLAVFIVLCVVAKFWIAAGVAAIFLVLSVGQLIKLYKYRDTPQPEKAQPSAPAHPAKGKAKK